MLDEPSAGLSPVLVDRVFVVVRRLREIVWIAAGFLASHLVSSPPGSPADRR